MSKQKVKTKSLGKIFFRKKMFLENINSFSTKLFCILNSRQALLSGDANTKLNNFNLFLIKSGFNLVSDNNLNKIFVLNFIEQFLTKTLKTPIIYKNVNLQNIIPSELLNYIMYSVKSVRWKKFYIIHSNEIIEMLFLCLWLKNINLFMKWVKKYFEKNSLKKHRKLFLFLKFLLGSFVWVHNIFFKLRGLRVILLGKFGKAGSVRKSRKYIKRGKCSYSQKELAMVNRTNFIRTKTGTFSIKLEIFF